MRANNTGVAVFFDLCDVIRFFSFSFLIIEVKAKEWAGRMPTANTVHTILLG